MEELKNNSKELSTINSDLANAEEVLILPTSNDSRKKLMAKKMLLRFKELRGKSLEEQPLENSLLLLALTINLSIYCHEQSENGYKPEPGLYIYWETLEICYDFLKHYKGDLLKPEQKAKWLALIGYAYVQTNLLPKAISCYKTAIACLTEPDNAAIQELKLEYEVELISVYCRLGYQCANKLQPEKSDIIEAKKNYHTALVLINNALKINSIFQAKLYYFKSQTLSFAADITIIQRDFSTAFLLLNGALKSNYEGLKIASSYTDMKKYLKHIGKCCSSFIELLKASHNTYALLLSNIRELNSKCNEYKQLIRKKEYKEFPKDQLLVIKKILNNIKGAKKSESIFWRQPLPLIENQHDPDKSLDTASEKKIGLA